MEFGYSRAVEHGKWCFVAGITGYDYLTMELPDGIAAQARNSIDTLRRVLEEAGFAFADLVRVTHYVADRGLVGEVGPVLGNCLSDVRPAATMVIAGLMQAEMLYEIEATASRGA